MPVRSSTRAPFPADGGTGQNPTTMAGLLALAPPGRLYSINPILPYIGPKSGSTIGAMWKSSNILEAAIILDPNNSSQYLMYYAGQLPGGGNGGGIGLATAPVSNPTQWTDYPGNPIALATLSGEVRLSDVVYDPVTTKINLYASIGNAHIELYTSAFNDHVTFAPFGTVWQPSQVAGVTGVTNVSNMGVLRVDAAHWYGYYSIRSSGEGTLTSIRVATSSDGKTWTDGAGAVLRTQAGTYYQTYIEGRNMVFTLGGQYAIVTSPYSGTPPATSGWTIGLATASSPTGPFTFQANPIFSPSGVDGSFDSVQVATPSIYNLNGQWYLFYQGSQSNGVDYNFNDYSIGMARF